MGGGEKLYRSDTNKTRMIELYRITMDFLPVLRQFELEHNEF